MTGPDLSSENNAARESTDRMMARGVRVALVAYSRALEDVLDQGVSSAVLVSEGIPWADIEKVLLAGQRGIVS